MFNSCPQPVHDYLSWAAVCNIFSPGLWSCGIQVLGTVKTHVAVEGIGHKDLEKVKLSLYT